MMEAIQLDLFDFVAMQTAVQSKVQEVPETIVPRNFQNDGRQGMPTTPAARIEGNFKAIRLLKELKAEKRVPSHEEQITLSQFSGWGGLTEVFMEGSRHYQALKELLSDEEYQTAQSSILDSYYTREYIIDFMWDLVRQELGIKSGKVAELGAGTGNFIGLAPFQKTYEFTAIEIDKISGNIAKTLYPESDIRIASLETVKLPEQYDLVIGNVPFGRFAPYDRNYRSYNAWNLHNYFISRALDCLKENGHAVLLTSSSTMDKPGSMPQITNGRAGLVKAYRLPNNTFAGTEIIADILILKKGYRENLSGNLQWVDTADNTGRIEVNSYFAQHPEHVFGKLSNTGKMYGKLNTPTVLPSDKNLKEHFDIERKEFMPALPEVPKNTDLFGNALPEATTPKVEVISYAERTDIPEEKDPPENCREYSIFSTLDAAYQVIDGMGHRMKDRKGANLTIKETQKVHSFVKIKNALNELIEVQLDFNAPDEEIEDLRIRLRCIYNDHVAKYGVLSNKTIHKYCVEDPEYLKVAAIENCRKVTETNKAGIKTTKKVYEPSDILFKRTQWPWREPDHAENVVEAGLISHAYRNSIDLEYIARITGKDTESVRTELLASGEYFYNPAAQRIELKSHYLSGHIKMKIGEAQAHGLTANAEALKTVLPKPLTIEDIDFALGSFWLPAELVQKWIAKDLNGKVEIHYDEDSDSWKVDTDYRSRQLLNQYNLDKLDTVELIELILNLKDPVIQKSVWNADRGTYVDVIDKEATLTARQYKNEIQNRFHDFVMDDRELALEVEQVYNECFNNYVLQQYDLPTFDVYPGASSVIDGKPFILREHQKRAVTRCIQENTLLAHAVGAGKTAVMITAAMELIRLKLAMKTMIVVQNATLQQFAEFAPKLYPTANILVATKNDLVKEKRKRFLGRIATGKWDIVIIAQSSFNMIEDNPDLVRAKYQSELDEMERVQGARNAAQPPSEKGGGTAQTQPQKTSGQTGGPPCLGRYRLLRPTGRGLHLHGRSSQLQTELLRHENDAGKGTGQRRFAKGVQPHLEAESDPRKNGRQEYLHGDWNACHEPASGAVQHGSLRIARYTENVPCGHLRPLRLDFYPERNGNGAECRRASQNGLAVLQIHEHRGTFQNVPELCGCDSAGGSDRHSETADQGRTSGADPSAANRTGLPFHGLSERCLHLVRAARQLEKAGIYAHSAADLRTLPQGDH